MVRRSREFEAELGRFNYVTPASYLELLNVYFKVVREKREELEGLGNRLRVGLERLAATREQVQELQKEEEHMQPLLRQTQADVDKILEDLNAEKAVQEESAKGVRDEEKIALKKAQVCGSVGLVARLLCMVEKLCVYVCVYVCGSPSSE